MEIDFHDFAAIALGFSSGVIFFTIVFYAIIRRR